MRWTSIQFTAKQRCSQLLRTTETGTCPPRSDLIFQWGTVVPDAGLVLERSLSASAAANEDAAYGPGRGNVRFLPSTTTRTEKKEL